MKEGDVVRYVGLSPNLLGHQGLFCWLLDYDLFNGEPLGWVAGLALPDGSVEYVEIHELEVIK